MTQEVSLHDPLFTALAQAADAAGFGVAVTIVEEPMHNVFVSDGLARLVGRSREEMSQIQIFSLVAPDEVPRLQEMLKQRRNDKPTPVVYQTLLVRPDGERVPVEVSSSRATINGRQANVTYVIDITRRKHAAAAIERADSLFRSLVLNAPDGIVILRGPFLVFANPSAAQLLGFDAPEDVLGRSILDLLHPDDARVAGERIQAMLRGGERFPAAFPYRPSAPRVRDTVVEISATPTEYEGAPAVLAFARDVTARRALEARVMRADRLAALGTLAAGVAHEINNPLAFVLLNLQYVEGKLPDIHDNPALMKTFLKRLREAITGAQRVGTIVRDLRTFARPDDDTREPVDVAAAVASAVRMAQHELRQRARIDIQLANLPAVDGNEGRVEQMFLNLLVNAAHAMDPDTLDRNVITISSRIGDDGTVTINVADNGRGIPEAVLARVYDPFFTTKPIGEGTGLGLPICQSIAIALGGSISIESELGRGTCVSVVLRVHQRRSVAPAAAQPTAPTRPSRRGRLLIVDDEPVIAETLAQLLSDRHDVDVASSGARALDLIADFPRYDVILCDLVMPGMTGMQLHARVVNTYPYLAGRMRFMTGGAFLPEAEAFLREGKRDAIQKPFDLEALTHLIDQALAEVT